MIIGDLLRRVDWLKITASVGKYALAQVLAGPAGVGLMAGKAILSKALDKVKDIDSENVEEFFRGSAGQELRCGIRKFRSDFQNLLDEAKIGTLVIVIDDLDRCLPDTIIETLEAIKLFLFVQRTAFVIGADERLVKYAVRRRFPELPGERVDVGRDYLEKLIQFPVRVPSLSRAEIEAYINLLFLQASGVSPERFDEARRCVVSNESHTLFDIRFNYAMAEELFEEVPPGLAENLALAERISPVLASGLNGNPRQCKRFLNSLVMRLRMAESRNVNLQQRILAKLMLLEYFKPVSFKQLSEIQAEENGKPEQMSGLEDQVRPFSEDKEERRDASKEPDPKPMGNTRTSEKKKDKQSNSHKSGEKTGSSISVSSDRLGTLGTWLADPWLENWLKMEPPLSGVDLRPYFFFARDILGPLGGAAQRLSPIAQEIVAKIFSESEAIRQMAFDRARDLSPADAAAVWEVIVTRVRQEEDPSSSTSAQRIVFDWVTARPEHFAQLVMLLERMLEGNLVPSTVPSILNLAKSVQEKQLARKLLEKWSSQEANMPLRIAANQRLGSLSQT